MFKNNFNILEKLTIGSIRIIRRANEKVFGKLFLSLRKCRRNFVHLKLIINIPWNNIERAIFLQKYPKCEID